MDNQNIRQTTEKQKAHIRQALQRFNQGQALVAEAKNAIKCVAVGMGVPDEWELNTQTLDFSAPVKPGEMADVPAT